MTNFDTNEWQFGAIDKNGNVVSPFQAYENYQVELNQYQWEMENRYQEKVSLDDTFSECIYLNENIHQLHFWDKDIVINIETQSVIYADNYESGRRLEGFISDFEGGTARVLLDGMDGFSGKSICRLGVDGTLTLDVDNIWAKYVFADYWNSTIEIGDGLLFVPYNFDGDALFIDQEFYYQTGDLDAAYDNGFTLHTGAYYSIEGELVIDFPEYNGKYNYYGGPFYNGYAAMMITGADGLQYMTVIDKNGELMFEPKSGFEIAYMSKDGKYVTAAKNGTIAVFDVSGELLVNVENKAIYLRNTPYETDYMRNTPDYNVNDGVIRIEDFYVNVEEGFVIGSQWLSDSGASVTIY